VCVCVCLCVCACVRACVCVCVLHQFATDTNVSRGSAVTHMLCGGIFSKYFATNLLDNLIVKKIENRLRINGVTAVRLMSFLFGNMVYICVVRVPLPLSPPLLLLLLLHIYVCVCVCVLLAMLSFQHFRHRTNPPLVLLQSAMLQPRRLRHRRSEPARCRKKRSATFTYLWAKLCSKMTSADLLPDPPSATVCRTAWYLSTFRQHL